MANVAIPDLTALGANVAVDDKFEIADTSNSDASRRVTQAQILQGLVITPAASTLAIASGKVFTVSNTLTFTGTDSSSVAFGAGGTVLYSGGALGTPSSGTVTNLTGTASININGTVGATTAAAGLFTTVGATGAASLYSGTALPAGGTTGSGLKFSSTANLGLFFGNGSPTLSAAQGSLYIQNDGSAPWYNNNGTTGWTQFVYPSGLDGGEIQLYVDGYLGSNSGFTLDITGSNLLTIPGNLKLSSATATITGGAGDMTVLAGTGNSRAMILQATTAGGAASTVLTLSDLLVAIGGGTTATELRFLEPSGSGSNYTAFKAKAQGASITYTLPDAVAGAGEFLCDVAGDGVLSWEAPAGSGTVTVVGAGNLTSTALMTGGGSQACQTPAATATLDSSGNIVTPGTISVGSGASTAGSLALTQGTTQSTGTTNITIQAPAAVTSYIRTLPGAVGSTGFLLETVSGSVQTETLVAGTGTNNVVRDTSPTMNTSIVAGGATFALLNTTATTVNAFGAATTLNIGAAATCILNFGGGTTASEFRFLEPSGSGTNYTAFKAVAQGASITYSLPPTVGAAGTFLTDAAGNGVLTWATPAGSGTVTATGGALTANAIVLGAGTTDTKVVSTLVTDGVSGITLGAPGTTAGKITFGNATSGTIVLTPVTGALGTVTVSLPATTGTVYVSSGTDVAVADGGTGLSSGTSGGVLAYTASGTLASSAALAANAIVIGGGAGAVPSTTTTGAGVLTALATAPNAAGGLVTVSTGTVNAPSITYTVEPGADDTAYGDKLAGILAGDTIAQWDLMYLDSSSGRWELADMDAVGTSGGVLLSLASAAGTDGGAMTAVMRGIVRNDGWTWTAAGKVLYASGTPGGMTETQPSGTDDVIRVVGYSLSDDCIWFEPSQSYITHT